MAYKLIHMFIAAMWSEQKRKRVSFHDVTYDRVSLYTATLHYDIVYTTAMIDAGFELI